MKRTYLLTLAFILFIWFIASILIAKPFVMPSPVATFSYLVEHFLDKTFYLSIGATFVRITFGFFFSLFVALCFSILSNEYPLFGRLFEPIHVLTKTIPNISYMIIALIWLGSEGAVTLVTFMILFPVFYNSFYQSLKGEEKTLKDVQKIYPESFWMKLIYKILPQLLPVIITTGKTAASLGFKVGIMAEILGSVNSGIGRQISYCKTQLDMAGIFAWTIVIILICIILDYLFNQMIQYKMKEENGWKS